MPVVDIRLMAEISISVSNLAKATKLLARRLVKKFVKSVKGYVFENLLNLIFSLKKYVR